MTVLSSRQRVRAIAQGRGDGHGIAVPLALALAARIAERDPEAFATDPTQLANGLRDLVDACDPCGVPVTMPDVILHDGVVSADGPRARAALEATRRLRSSMGDRLALVACLPGTGPAGDATAVTDLAKAFLSAGADAIVILGSEDGEPGAVPLRTLANIARFHQAVALSRSAEHGLPVVDRMPLASPSPGSGLVITDTDLPRDVDVVDVADWVAAVRG